MGILCGDTEKKIIVEADPDSCACSYGKRKEQNIGINSLSPIVTSPGHTCREAKEHRVD